VAVGGTTHTEEMIEGWANMEAQVAVFAAYPRDERKTERLGLLPVN
jgi:hypothetical protein